MDLNQENHTLGFANKKGTDQTVLVRSLINTFVIRLLESMIS